jgi:hypothetical protein
MAKLWDGDVFLNNMCFSEPGYLPAAKAHHYSNDALENDLLRLKQAWERFQNDRDRDAVYGFLAEVFELVSWWHAERKAVKYAERFLARSDWEGPDKIEPFGAVIIAAAEPAILDKRVVSKWSRVLRFAAAYKSPADDLAKFVKAKGGINACAARYSRLRRRAKKDDWWPL